MLFRSDGGELDFDYVGLNHLGWLRSLSTAGHDRLPDLLASDEALERIEEEILRLTGRKVETLVYGDGAFKDPVCGIWELADPVVSPGYTDGLKGTPSEVKFKMIADNAQGDAEEAVRNAIRSKPAASGREAGLSEEKNALGTTPRRYTDLLGSLCDLVSGSGDRGTPVVHISGYFDSYIDG